MWCCSSLVTVKNKNFLMCIASLILRLCQMLSFSMTVLPCQLILWCSYRQCCATDTATLPVNPMVFLQEVLCNWHCYLASQSYGVPPGSVVQLTVLPCQSILWCSSRQCCATDTATLPVNPVVFLQAVLCNWHCYLASQSYGVPPGSVVQLTVLPCQAILWCSSRKCCATDTATLPVNPMVFLQEVLCNWQCCLARQSYGVPPGSVVQLTVLPCQAILWCSSRQCCATDSAALPGNPMVFLQAVLCNWQCCLARQSYGVPPGSVMQLTVLPCQAILWCSSRQCYATADFWVSKFLQHL